MLDNTAAILLACYPLLWLKALHLCFAVFWYAGLLYLPRLFVYHCECDTEAERARFAIMERRLYRGIMWPAALVTLGLGLAMLWSAPEYLRQDWMWGKLGILAVLYGYHLYCGHCLKRLASEPAAPHSARFFRVFNEVPALLLIALVLLAVLRP